MPGAIIGILFMVAVIAAGYFSAVYGCDFVGYLTGLFLSALACVPTLKVFYSDLSIERAIGIWLVVSMLIGTGFVIRKLMTADQALPIL